MNNRQQRARERLEERDRLHKTIEYPEFPEHVFDTTESFRRLTVDAGYYDFHQMDGGDKGAVIHITCTDTLNRVQDVEPGEQYAPITPQTARELAAHLITLADKLEGKAE